MATVGVYKLVDPATGVFYIGSTGNLEKRLKRHLKDLSGNKHHSRRMQTHHNGTSDVDWKIEMVALTDGREAAYRLEERLINENKDNSLLLNVNLKGRGVVLRKGSPEYWEWLDNRNSSQRRMLESMTPEERKALWGRVGESNGMFGKTHTDEAKAKLSEVHKGNSHARGFVRSEEQRKFISRMASLRTGTKNPFYGKRHSDATRQRLSDHMKANPRLPGNARKVSVDDVVYESLTAAESATGVSKALLIYRIRSDKPKYTGYCYV